MNNLVTREYILEFPYEEKSIEEYIEVLKTELCGAAATTCYKHLAFYTMKMIDAIRVFPREKLNEHYPGVSSRETPLDYIYRQMISPQPSAAGRDYSLMMKCDVLFAPYGGRTYMMFTAAAEDFFVTLMQLDKYPTRQLSHVSFNSENIPLVGRTMIKDVVWGTGITQIVASAIDDSYCRTISFSYPPFDTMNLNVLCVYLRRQSFIERVADVAIPLIDEEVSLSDKANGVFYVVDSLSSRSPSFLRAVQRAVGRVIKDLTPDDFKKTVGELFGEELEKEKDKAAKDNNVIYLDKIKKPGA